MDETTTIDPTHPEDATRGARDKECTVGVDGDNPVEEGACVLYRGTAAADAGRVHHRVDPAGPNSSGAEEPVDIPLRMRRGGDCDDLGGGELADGGLEPD